MVSLIVNKTLYPQVQNEEVYLQSSPLNGVYTGLIKVDGTTKMSKIYLYHTNPYLGKYSYNSRMYDFMVVERIYPNKKGQGYPRTLYYTGKLTGSGSKYNLEKEVMINSGRVRPTGFFSTIEISGKKTLKIPSAKYKRVEETFDPKILRELSEELIRLNIKNNSLVIGNKEAYYPRTWGPKKEIGVTVSVKMNSLPLLLEKEKLRATYKVYDNINTDSYYQPLSGRIERIMRNLFPSRYIPNLNNQWLTHFRHAASIDVYHAEYDTRDFIIHINRVGGRLTYQVEVTNEINISEELRRKEFRKTKISERERQLTIKKNRIKFQAANGVNASGKLIEIAFPVDSNPWTELGAIPNVSKMILGIYYGRFKDVNPLYFSGLHNGFIAESSQRYGRQVSKSTESVEFTNGKKVYMDARFLNKFKTTIKPIQISGSNFFGEFLEKYPPSSIVYRQFCENLYRYSKGMPPASEMAEISF